MSSRASRIIIDCRRSRIADNSNIPMKIISAVSAKASISVSDKMWGKDKAQHISVRMTFAEPRTDKNTFTLTRWKQNSWATACSL